MLVWSLCRLSRLPVLVAFSFYFIGMASLGEANLLRISGGFIRPFPGGNGPVNEKRMEEIRSILSIAQSALTESGYGDSGAARVEAMMELLRELLDLFQDARRREEAAPILAEISSVAQMVTVEVLEIRGTRAMRNALNLFPTPSLIRLS